MDNMQQILMKESKNDSDNNQIYLYKINDYWFAYEYSAFYLYSICCVDAVFKYVEPENKKTILISVLKNGYEKAGNPQLRVIERTEHQMVLNCGIKCKGFQQWKDGWITLFKDRYFVQIIQEFYRSLCKL
ncbi:MAG: hypothetical protein LBT43_01335 [Prevotella sp.]|jgi:hypothetical protein|uniref:Uncharacterized protein n=1 Tax=Dysgonomonas gadei ATCC BAA-286 TaxID=742766 RepID=F5ITE8_9BACT|nr:MULTISPECIES: hypothetical protein [Dysgonomonas]EGJ99332.1 hypothetical protein HMPREF9455_00365 [Dysgonomonas gadei ATCC BAA-286]MBF0647615.1 hypothetical protein [Dysgonomonas sp. GY75]MDR1501085.1 hypothetical protein [Prevotella sp.]